METKLDKKFIRVIHVILESPQFFEKIHRGYINSLNVSQNEIYASSAKFLENIARFHSKPHRKTLDRLALVWKEMMNDERSPEEISSWMLLPYDYSLLSSFYGTPTEK